MPSVFTLEQACPWQLKKGRKVKGCFVSERAAKRAAGNGWRPYFSRPPGVPMGKSKRLRGATPLPRWSDRSQRWIRGSKNTLYVFTDTRTGRGWVMPVYAWKGSPEVTEIRAATRAEAEGKVKGVEGWQKKLHAGWKVKN